MKTASLALLLLVCAVNGFKLATDLSANRSNFAERPACTGDLLKRKVGDDHWQCDSLSGDRGTEAEAKCTGSYDTDGTAYSYRFRQCEVRVLSESRFNCLAATPCEAPEDQHGHKWQQTESDVNKWDKLAEVKNFELETSTVLVPNELRDFNYAGGGSRQGILRLSDTTALVCAKTKIASRWGCFVLDYSGSTLVAGPNNYIGQEHGNPNPNEPVLVEVSANKALWCGREKFNYCRLLVVDGNKVEQKGRAVEMPHGASRIALMVTAVELSEGRVLVCQNEDYKWKKDSRTSCAVATVDTDTGDITWGPLTTLLQGGRTWPYAYAEMRKVGPDTVLLCHNSYLASGSNDECGIVKVTDTGIEFAGQPLQLSTQSHWAYTLGMFNSKTALFCSQVKKKCTLLSISGSTVSKLGDEIPLPVGPVSLRLTRLWKDAMLYCWTQEKGGESSNAWCSVAKLEGETVTFSEGTHLNGKGDREPWGYYVVTETLAPGKVIACNQDREGIRSREDLKSECTGLSLKDGR